VKIVIYVNLFSPLISPRPPSRPSPKLLGRWQMSCNERVEHLVSELFWGWKANSKRSLCHFCFSQETAEILWCILHSNACRPIQGRIPLSHAVAYPGPMRNGELHTQDEHNLCIYNKHGHAPLTTLSSDKCKSSC